MIPVKFFKDSLSAKRLESEFYNKGRELRSYFEDRYDDPLKAKSENFCWDYWSVPNQYRLLRTPASSFFPEEMFQPFVEHLLNWGRENLGCQMISHPWLSAYIDGSFQNLHSDVPHGPYSFVYSLTPWKKRKFTGGETLIAKPTLLRYFGEVSIDRSHETVDLIEKVPPQFNQLTLFDPRYPHGVERVQGVESLLDSRLVIHGWFTEPRPMLEGSLSYKKVSKPLDQIAEIIMKDLADLPFQGLLSLRIKVLPSGKIAQFEVLAGHLVDSFGQTIPKKDLATILKTIDLTFPKSSGSTLITLPLQIYF